MRAPLTSSPLGAVGNGGRAGPCATGGWGLAVPAGWAAGPAEGAADGQQVPWVQICVDGWMDDLGFTALSTSWVLS